jgi:BirA family transcriptional regulator, biotin operon repressor / biotin---[acetyl-CoA-carboxylase] ligase
MNLIVFPSIDSTNNYLKQHGDTLPHMTIVRARYQTAGRGQHQRLWQSNPNENILVSLLYKSIHHESALKILEQQIINGIIAFLNHYGVKAKHKLPNDIYVHDKKISGMLIETRRTGIEIDQVIVGIGININQRQFFDLSFATSLSMEKKIEYPIDEVFDTLLTFLPTKD